MKMSYPSTPLDLWKDECGRLKAMNAELLAALELAVKYLDHPDVQAIPFALHAECAANRAREAIAKHSSK